MIDYGFRTGDGLCCIHPASFDKTGVVQFILRRIYGIDHIAGVVIIDDVIWVHESSHKLGGVVKNKLSDWLLLHPGVKFYVCRPKSDMFNPFLFNQRMNEQNGKPYDVVAVLWYHLVYQSLTFVISRLRKCLKINIPLRWFGPTNNGKALDKLYCVELYGYANDMSDWYKLTLRDIYTSGKFIVDGVLYYDTYSK